MFERFGGVIETFPNRWERQLDIQVGKLKSRILLLNLMLQSFEDGGVTFVVEMLLKSETPIVTEDAAVS